MTTLIRRFRSQAIRLVTVTGLTAMLVTGLAFAGTPAHADPLPPGLLGGFAPAPQPTPPSVSGFVPVPQPNPPAPRPPYGHEQASIQIYGTTFKIGQTASYGYTLSAPAYVTIRDSVTGAVLVSNRYVGAGTQYGTMQATWPEGYDALTLSAYFPQSGRTVTVQSNGTWIYR